MTSLLTSLQVIEESQVQCAHAATLVAEIRKGFPEIIKAIKTRQLSLEILVYKDLYLKGLEITGSLLHPIATPRVYVKVAERFGQ